MIKGLVTLYNKSTLLGERAGMRIPVGIDDVNAHLKFSRRLQMVLRGA